MSSWMSSFMPPFCIWGECYGASESTERSDREWARIDVTGDSSLGTTIGIRAKFESPESHRSDFGGERKPILNSDQIRSAQKWRLSIPPDSSRRDEAPASNRVKIGRRSHPHAPPEVSARQIHARPRAGAPEEGDDGLPRAPTPHAPTHELESPAAIFSRIW
ncbi:hypothetical protein Acr_25g0004380 [Actinidia rufa]|uniref:Uncharacterized protein n=1 Tax=Actinidia rufa TaxID=165716 RepID=A0A7J0GYY8_9ERIC|nr:hypothetical protein Acr_25g0004380 [Actinidia rufa]